MTALAGVVEPTLGEHLRDEALRRVLLHCPPGDPWRVQAVQLIADLAAEGVVFEAYDLIRRGLPEPDHSSRWGAVFQLCGRQGLIDQVNTGRSARPTVKGSLVRFWRGAL
jgi:hypothetical protein